LAICVIRVETEPALDRVMGTPRRPAIRRKTVTATSVPIAKFAHPCG